MYFPNISIPSSSARARVVKMQRPAPSPTPLALPAVVLDSPQSGKAGFKAESPSSVTPCRMVSSTETTEPLNSIGIISSANIPFARAWRESRSTFAIYMASEMGTCLACSAVRYKCIFVLFLARYFVGFRHHFRCPSHGLTGITFSLQVGHTRESDTPACSHMHGGFWKQHQLLRALVLGFRKAHVGLNET